VLFDEIRMPPRRHGGKLGPCCCTEAASAARQGQPRQPMAVVPDRPARESRQGARRLGSHLGSRTPMPYRARRARGPESSTIASRVPPVPRIPSASSAEAPAPESVLAAEADSGPAETAEPSAPAHSVLPLPACARLRSPGRTSSNLEHVGDARKVLSNHFKPILVQQLDGRGAGHPRASFQHDLDARLLDLVELSWSSRLSSREDPTRKAQGNQDVQPGFRLLWIERLLAAERPALASARARLPRAAAARVHSLVLGRERLQSYSGWSASSRRARARGRGGALPPRPDLDEWRPGERAAYVISRPRAAIRGARDLASRTSSSASASGAAARRASSRAATCWRRSASRYGARVPALSAIARRPTAP